MERIYITKRLEAPFHPCLARSRAHVLGTAAPSELSWACDVLLMIEIAHYLKDPKLWELWYILNMGKAGIASTIP